MWESIARKLDKHGNTIFVEIHVFGTGGIDARIIPRAVDQDL